MSKKFVVLAAGVLMAAVSAASATAAGVPRSVTPEEQTVEPSASFSVTYSQCASFETVVFEFEGQPNQQLACGDLVDESLTTPQGFRSVPAGLENSSVTATFTAPATGGDYRGIAYVVQQNPNLEAPAQPQGFRGSGLVTQTPPPRCTPQLFDCRGFTVTVLPQQVTTTTAAPTTTTGQAPTTTSGGVSGGGVTNTLPATGASDSDNTATIAIVLLVAGFGLIVATRWRGVSDHH